MLKIIDKETVKKSAVETRKYGAESAIYKYTNGNKTMAYKEFVLFPHDDKNLLINKKQKLILLEQKHELKELCALPVELVNNILKDNIAGYTMDWYDGETITLNTLLLESRIKALEEIRKILLRFENNGILYLDLNTENILYKENSESLEIYFVDMDNSKIENLPMDLLPSSMKKYINNNGKYNINALFYMYNKLVEEVLDLTNNQKVEIEKEGIKIIESIHQNEVDSIGDHENLLQYIKIMN